MKEKSKNLIVIIGNGFDLAHGLKTSYNHFAYYYLEEIILTKIFDFENNKQFLNKELLIYLNQNIMTFSDLSTESTDDKFLNDVSYFIQQNKTDKVSTFLNSNNEYVKLLISNKLLGKLYSNSFENWFDIEQAYYEELKDIYNSPKENHNDELKTLNNNLKEIKKALKKYLNDKIEPTPDRNIHYCLSQHITDRQNISFINFNYTNTIKCYKNLEYDTDLILNPTIKNIHIHNSLSEDIIFGYGDDTDEMYQKMKASKNNSFLKYFKTFDYLKSKNYRKVLNQLATFDKYDVLVIGHSLGGTDKTILKTILDDDSCQNIELLKRSDFDTDERYKELNLVEKEQLKADNLFELYANLARIFDSEASLREKVIPFEWSINFPVMANYDYDKIQKREKELFIKKEKSTLIEPGTEFY
ncbi:AbiH family protein [Tenacibaculum dicentrarchi]|uniref:AbiH family protein n=1 Tax=Tenacibaculum dicentrarchi TaxID=669041 RepID=UPI0035114D9E